jgi:hypothetical protein
MFVRDYTIKLLGTSFPNMTATEVYDRLVAFYTVFGFCVIVLTSFPGQVTKFVDGLLSSKHDLPSFKNHIRDFLVQSKEFSAQVISSCFPRHHQIPFIIMWGKPKERSGSLLLFVRTWRANGPLMPPGDWLWILLLFCFVLSANCLVMYIFFGLLPG